MSSPTPNMDSMLYEAAMNGDLIYLQNMTPQQKSDLSTQLAPNENTILHVATEYHQADFVRAVIGECPSLLCLANLSGDTALHLAAREGLVAIVELLVDLASSRNTQTINDIESGRGRNLTLFRMVNTDKDTALHCAAREGHYRCLELLVRKDPDVCSLENSAEESPLYLAVAAGYWDVPEVIINNARTSASYKGANGLTALHPTLYFLNYDIHKVELLVSWRPEMITKPDHLGLTPLHYAALYGRTEAVKLFLEHDSSVIYQRDGNGESALHIAAFRGYFDVLEEIITCRHDSCYLVDNKGRTILHAAVLGNQREVVKFILETPMLARLRNKADGDGNTPLHLAAFFKFYTIIDILAKGKKVNISFKNKEFLTPLDVFNQHDEEGFRATVARDVLKGATGTMAMQRLAKEQIKLMNRETGVGTLNPSTSEPPAIAENIINKERSGLGKQSALEVNLLVATLVATVTFAAGFQMPGGNEDNGPDEGLAILAAKAAFEVFVVFNTIAFCCSVFAVLLQFHTSLTDHSQRVRYMAIAAFFTTVAILAMLLAFAFGSFVVLTKSTRLSITPFVICVCFALFYFAIPFCDPGVEGFPFLKMPQKVVRYIIVKCIRYED